MVLLFDSKLKLFPRKLKSRWEGSYRVVTIFLYGQIELKKQRRNEI